MQEDIDTGITEEADGTLAAGHERSLIHCAGLAGDSEGLAASEVTAQWTRIIADGQMRRRPIRGGS